VNAVTVPITYTYTVDDVQISEYLGSFVVLHIEMLERLLRTDLTASKRLPQQDLVAITASSVLPKCAPC